MAWYELHGRHDLPWQQPATPYRVCVSEVMLQQTQVATVVPYFQRFMARFADVASLAAASQDEVLSYWSGLGYYARGRNLHKAAQQMVARHGAQVPDRVEDLLALPGIGQSTAHAILSLAFGQPTAICDGNVKRVLARWFALDEVLELPVAQQWLWQAAQALHSHSRSADYTQAIMDLGATLCTRSRPACDRCPVSAGCAALSSGLSVTGWPRRRAKKNKPVRRVGVLLQVCERRGLWLQAPAQVDGLWGGLYQLPQWDEAQAPSLPARVLSLPPMRHTFTHFHLDVQPWLLRLEDGESPRLCAEGVWYNFHEQGSGPARPALVDKLIRQWRRMEVGHES